MKRTDPVAADLTPEALAPVVSDLYALGGGVTCDFLSSGLNDLFKVEAGGNLHALKVYRRGWRSREEVLGEIAALRHLENHGVRVARLIPRADGEAVWTLVTAA